MQFYLLVQYVMDDFIARKYHELDKEMGRFLYCFKAKGCVRAEMEYQPHCTCGVGYKQVPNYKNLLVGVESLKGAKTEMEQTCKLLAWR